MHFFILGGSGRTGQQLVDQALAQGHTVSILARDPSKIKERDGVSVVKGDCYEEEDVKTWFAGGKTPDAVLVALSPLASDNPFAAYTAPKDLLTRANALAIEEMKIRGIDKLVVLQACGVGDGRASMSFAMRLLVDGSSVGLVYADHDATQQLLAREQAEWSLRWVCVRPPILGNGPAKPVKHWGDRGVGIGLTTSISRASVAAFMLEAAQKDEWDGHTPVISN